MTEESLKTENEIRKIAYAYWNGEIDYVDEKYATQVINYMGEHPEEFDNGYRGM